MPTTNQPRVLIVNHSADVALLLKLAVRDAFPEAVIETATSRQDARARIRATAPNVVILAVDGPAEQARELAPELAARSCSLILSGNRPDMPQLATELGAAATLRRPARRAELEAAIRHALEGSSLPLQSEEVRPPERERQERRT